MKFGVLSFALAALVMFVPLAVSSPIIYDSGILTIENGGLVATAGWNNSSTFFDWTVTDTGLTDANGYIIWQYDYEFKVPRKDISHLILQVSNTASSNDFTFAAYDPSKQTLDTYSSTSQGNSNPGMPDAMYGIKFESGSNGLDYVISFTTWRSPVWGDFYAKDGKDRGVDVYAYNAGFTSGDQDLGKAHFDILVPDTKGTTPDPGPTPVPEPSSLILIGSGIIALGLASRRKSGK
jgi:hypothetical protein